MSEVDIPRVQVTSISKDGVWLLAGQAFFLSFEDFPWFMRATVEEAFEVVESEPDYFHWPMLDVGLSLREIRKDSARWHGERKAPLRDPWPVEE